MANTEPEAENTKFFAGMCQNCLDSLNLSPREPDPDSNILSKTFYVKVSVNSQINCVLLGLRGHHGTSIYLLDTAAHIILDLEWHGGDLEYLPYQNIALSTSEYSN